MLGSSLIPARWRGFYDPEDPSKPGWYNKKVTPFLQNVSQRACTHPVHTITFFAILASSMYIGLLETGLFEPSPAAVAGRLDVKALAAGSRRLHVGPETAWKWQLEEAGHAQPVAENVSAQTSERLCSHIDCKLIDTVESGSLPHHSQLWRIIPGKWIRRNSRSAIHSRP